MSLSSVKHPFLLLVLDGWGHRENAENRDNKEFNAIEMANTPNWDRLWLQAPCSLISASGADVGLPAGQMGNSEVGHMTLGAGRVIDQDLTRITKSISTGSFFENAVMKKSFQTTIRNKGRVHIIGLLSAGGVHSHEDHIKAAIQMAFQEGVDTVYVHAFLDGRDVPPKSALESIRNIEKFIQSKGKGGIASVVGRYYAMDRDNRWERISLAYDLLTGHSQSHQASSSEEALLNAYDRGETDEFVKPTIVTSQNKGGAKIEDLDTVIFMNFRADRARQLTRAFTENNFGGFERARKPELSSFVTLTEYASDIQTEVAFNPLPLTNCLAEYLARMGKTQLRLAETEKYAHVTFFFSCGREALFDGEERILIPSPDVSTYDLQPEMSAPEITSSLINALESRKFDLIVCNFANGDMVGHTGNLDAAIKAVECVDKCLGEIVSALKTADAQCLITADHGNVEKMTDSNTNQPHTAHTSELVPLIYIGEKDIELQSQAGNLSDLAPSILDLMNLPQPDEMTGTSLILKGRTRVDAK